MLANQRFIKGLIINQSFIICRVIERDLISAQNLHSRTGEQLTAVSTGTWTLQGLDLRQKIQIFAWYVKAGLEMSRSQCSNPTLVPWEGDAQALAAVLLSLEWTTGIPQPQALYSAREAHQAFPTMPKTPVHQDLYSSVVQRTAHQAVCSVEDCLFFSNARSPGFSPKCV